MHLQILFITGLALICTGIGCIYWPLALIFAGIALALIAFKLAQHPASDPETTTESHE